MEVTLRPATLEDARFVALVMAEAIGDDIMERCPLTTEKDLKKMTMLEALAKHPNTLYSYQRATLAVDGNGDYLGGLIAYPAEGYLERRKLTFDLCREWMFFDPDKMDPETVDGEYYLDSLAVLPAYRGQGIARKLLQHGIVEGKRLGLLPVLACSPENASAHRIYTSLGFADEGRLFIFGENYLRMSHK